MSTTLRVRYQTIELGDLDIHVRTLRDTREFSDDDGVAEALGISSAMWPLFGVVWAASRVLAGLMVDQEVAGKRVLEVGCGIGLASLVLNQRHADITATDGHPEAGGFLRHNVALNAGVDLPFVRAAWSDVAAGAELGTFDLIIGSDLLYEPGQAEALASFVNRHARAACEVIVVDAGRGHGSAFRKRMAALGFACTARQVVRGAAPGHGAFRGQVVTCRR